jgi:two-component system, sensor histidine kinase and response regulator
MTRPRLLIVEDTPLNRELFAQLLEDTYDIQFAVDGESALTCVQQGNFDGVLLDIAIPLIDGYEVARAIREHEATEGRRRLPIIAVTAHATEGARQRALAVGCDAHITKPIDEEELFASLVRWIPTRTRTEDGR